MLKREGAATAAAASRGCGTRFTLILVVRTAARCYESSFARRPRWSRSEWCTAAPQTRLHCTAGGGGGRQGNRV